MPREDAKKAKIPYKKPTLTEFGPWPDAEGKIRERALAQGMTHEEIEVLLDRIREATKANVKSTDEA